MLEQTRPSNMHVVAVVPEHSFSGRTKNKTTRTDFCGKSLIEWCVIQFACSKNITRAVLVLDSNRDSEAWKAFQRAIAYLEDSGVYRLDSIIPLARPIEMEHSMEDSGSPPMQYGLKWYLKSNTPNVIFTHLATDPLLFPYDLDNAIEAYARATENPDRFSYNMNFMAKTTKSFNILKEDNTPESVWKSEYPREYVFRKYIGSSLGALHSRYAMENRPPNTKTIIYETKEYQHQHIDTPEQFDFARNTFDKFIIKGDPDAYVKYFKGRT